MKVVSWFKNGNHLQIYFDFSLKSLTFHINLILHKVLFVDSRKIKDNQINQKLLKSFIKMVRMLKLIKKIKTKFKKKLEIINL